MILGTISRWWFSVSSTLVWMMTKTLIGVASSLDFWGREWRGQGNCYWTIFAYWLNITKSQLVERSLLVIGVGPTFFLARGRAATHKVGGAAPHPIGFRDGRAGPDKPGNTGG